MNEMAELRRLYEQQQQQNAALAACNEQLTRDNERFLNDAKSAAAQVSDLQQENTDLRTQLQQSHDELAALLRRIFGRTSERYMGDTAGQLLLAFDSEDDIEDARAGILQALEEHREQTEAKKKKRRKRRGTSELFPHTCRVTRSSLTWTTTRKKACSASAKTSPRRCTSVVRCCMC